MTLWCIYTFYLDEDATVIEFKAYYNNEIDIYPKPSICFTLPYELKKLQEHGKNISLTSYSKFLSGHEWNGVLAKIQYGQVILDTKEYFLWYKLTYRTGRYEVIDLTVANKSSDTEWDFPSVSFAIDNLLCFGIEIPSKVAPELIAIGVGIKTDIFPTQTRPAQSWPDDIDQRSLMVIMHFPGQILRARSFQNEWPPRNAYSSKNYVTSFAISSVEVVEERSKHAQFCTDGPPLYDTQVFEDIAEKVRCRAPYFKPKQNLSLCSNKKQMQKHKELGRSEWTMDNLNHLPCRHLGRIQYGMTEIDVDNTDPPVFEVKFTYKEQTYKLIKKVQNFDVQALIGNAGGYLGLFIGYALIGIPGMLRMLIHRIKQLFGKGEEESYNNTVVQYSSNTTEQGVSNPQPYNDVAGVV